MCQSCHSVAYGGRVCHQAGCPEAWRDESHACLQCGQVFQLEYDGQLYCGQVCRIADGGGILELAGDPLDADPLIEELWDKVQAALGGN